MLFKPALLSHSMKSALKLWFTWSFVHCVTLNMAGQLHVGFARGTGLEAAVITRPGNACELAEMLNVDFAGIRCSHDFDDFREAGAVEPCRSAASKARKAF
jgi:hypothetical protein